MPSYDQIKERFPRLVAAIERWCGSEGQACSYIQLRYIRPEMPAGTLRHAIRVRHDTALLRRMSRG
jgi:hypothetical protein